MQMLRNIHDRMASWLAGVTLELEGLHREMPLGSHLRYIVENFIVAFAGAIFSNLSLGS